MTLSLRADDRGRLRSMEKWSNPGAGWSNQHSLETAMSPLFYHSTGASSMFPTQLISGLSGAAEQQALVQAFSQANADSMLDSPGDGGGSLDRLLGESNSSSMADSTSEMTGGGDDDTTGQCSQPIPPPPVLSVSSLVDRAGSTGATSVMVSVAEQEKMLLHHHKEMFCMEPVESPGGPLSPGALQIANCSRGESDDSLGGGADPTGVTLKRQFENEEDAWMEHMPARKVSKQQEKALVFQDNFHGYIGTSSPGAFAPAVGSVPGFSPTVADPITTIPAPALAGSGVMPPPPPFLPTNVVPVGTDADKMAGMRAILFRHASLPVPTLEEIANSRPKRRNVRISKDPQSVAARHRRERISDRIRVLQRLVPGGTKMDTASMLDEAIHYVKFLKLQLQTLEQIGNNNCDPRFMPQGGGPLLPQITNPVRPFDLNCAAYQAWPPTTMMNQTSQGMPSLPSSTWPSAAGGGSYGNQGFPDPIQEQFCH